MIIKRQTATYEIIDWNGEEYYRFSANVWKQRILGSLERIQDDEMLENAYQAITSHSSVRVSSEKYKTRLA